MGTSLIGRFVDFWTTAYVHSPRLSDTFWFSLLCKLQVLVIYAWSASSADMTWPALVGQQRWRFLPVISLATGLPHSPNSCSGSLRFGPHSPSCERFLFISVHRSSSFERERVPLRIEHQQVIAFIAVPIESSSWSSGDHVTELGEQGSRTFAQVSSDSRRPPFTFFFPFSFLVRASPNVACSNFLLNQLVPSSLRMCY